LLIKAHNITGNDAYLTTAKELVDALFIDIDEGGLTYKNDTEGWWYEEYSGEGGWNPRVLNGMLYTLIGTYNFHNYTGDPSAKYLFQKGIEGLKQQIHLYDHNQTYSSYDIVGGYAPYGYHRIHVDLLRELYLITHEDIFKKYHDAWGKFILPNQDSPSFYTQIGCQTGQSKEFK
jgi:heparosan-N-sulfate-glucuronate 5-epimerase